MQITAQVDPSPSKKTPRCYCRPDQTPWWKTLLEIAAIAFGITAVFIYKGQWDAAATANSLNADNFRQGQRPWVGPDIDSAPHFLKLGDAGMRSSWLMRYKNYGNSPALHAKWHTRLMHTTEPIDWDQIQHAIESLPTVEQNESIIFNGQSSPDFGTSNDVVTEDYRAAVLNHSVLLILGGRAIYQDEFGASHETTFCFVYDPPTPEAPGEWSKCMTRDIAN